MRLIPNGAYALIARRLSETLRLRAVAVLRRLNRTFIAKGSLAASMWNKQALW